MKIGSININGLTSKKEELINVVKKNNIEIDAVFSSVLKRANKTAEIALKEIGLEHLWTCESLNMIKKRIKIDRLVASIKSAVKVGHTVKLNFILEFLISVIKLEMIKQIFLA